MTAERPRGLDAEDLRIAYGGNLAVEAVTFSAPLGAVTGLIGPNGAGKTSTFNACNGLVTPVAGRITLFGHDITSHSPAARARAGLGRTFQTMQLCNALDVRANVALGAEARLAGANPLRQLASSRARRNKVRAATDTALELCGISHLAAQPTAAMSVGPRRLIELARVLAGEYPMLLLDEPSSGLDEEETGRFGQILAGLVQSRGVGLLLVEHDVGLVMSLCDHIYVLDFGRTVFDGTPKATRDSPVVRAAYLGEDVGNDVRVR